MSVQTSTEPARRRRWLARSPRLRRALWVLGIALLVLRFSQSLWLEPTVRRLARGTGIELSWTDLELTLWRGAFELRGLELRVEGAEAGLEPRLAVDYLAGDLDMGALLMGKLGVQRVSIGHAVVELQRGAKGGWGFEALQGGADGVEGVDPGSAPEPAAPATSLALPLSIERVEIAGLELHLVDAARQLDQRVSLSFEGRELGRADRAGALELELVVPGVLEALRIEGELTAAREALGLELQVALVDLRPAALAELAAALGVRGLGAAAREVDGGFGVSLTGALDDSSGSAVASWSAALDGLELRADGRPVLALDELGVEFVGSGLGAVRARGLALHAGRNEADELVGLGFRLGAVETAGSGAVPGDAGAQEDNSMAAFGPFDVADLRLFWADHSASLEAPCELELALTSLSLGALDGGGEPAAFELELSAPGVFGRARIDGELALGSAGHASARLAVSGLAPLALAPYLRAAGIESRLQAAELSADFEARLAAQPSGGPRLDAELTGVVLADAAELVVVDGLIVRGLRLGARGLDVESVELVGPELGIVRRADGALEVAGLTLIPRPLVDPDAGPDVVSPAASGPAALPELRIGRLAFTGTRLSWRDETLTPALVVQPESLELSLDGFSLGLGAQAPATLHLELAQAGLVEALTVEARLTPTLFGAAGNADGKLLEAALVGSLEATGLSSELWAPYLAQAGVEGALEGGVLSAGLEASLALAVDGGVGARVQLEALALRGRGADGAVDVGLARLDVSLEIDSAGLHFGAVLVDRPELALVRDEAGRWGWGGLIFGAAPAAATGTEPVAGAEPAGAAAAVTLLGFELRGGMVSLDDRFVPGGTLVSLGLDARVSELAPGLPAKFELDLVAPGRLEAARLAGVLSVGADETRIEGHVQIDGVRGAALASYLSEGLAVDLDDGSVGFEFEASIKTQQQGERAVGIELRKLYSRDSGGPRLLVERLGLQLARLSRQVVEVTEVALEGVSLDVRKDLSGALHVAGLVLSAAPPTAVPATDELSPASAPAPAAEPLRPLLSLGWLRLELAHLGFTDERWPDALPLELAFVLENRAPWTCDLGGEEEAVEPLGLKLTGTARPVAESIELDVDLAPFRAEPHLAARLAIAGLSGSGLAAALPELAQVLDASAVEGGRFSAELQADLDVARRGPFALDLSRGIGGDFELKDVGFARAAEAPVELGFRSLSVELRSASAAGIEIAQLDLEDPVGRIEVLPEGLSVAGWVFLNGAEPEPAPEPLDSAAVDENAPEVSASMASEPASTFDVAIPAIFVSGLDFVYRDATVEPVLELPLEDLDLSITGFTTRAFAEPVPIGFTLYAGAGEVALARREDAANLITGILGAAVDVVSGESDEFDTEQRPAFGSLDAAGRLVLFPAPKGWVTLALAGLELPVFRGAARSGGVEIGDGLLDLDLDVRLLGERGAAVSLRASAAHLSLSEPAGGPISTYLKLPAPLDTVLFLLRNEDGDVVLPLDLSVAPDGGIDGLGTEITKTLGLVIGEAIASSPMRLVGGVLDMTGLTNKDPVVLPEEPAAVAFFAASSELSSSLEQELAQTFELLRRDPELKVDLVHVFGKRDLAALAERANPGPEVCRELAGRLAVERDLLLSAREEEATRLRARFAAGDHSRMEAGRVQLLELDGELALVEDALDSVLGLLRPGAERRAGRRTRTAALLLAEQRLEVVHAAIEAQPIISIGKRLRVRRPRFDAPELGPGRVLVVPR